MKSTQIEAKEVKVGDRVITDEGAVIMVTEIGKGMPYNTIELRWRGGWFAINPTRLIERMV